MSFRITFVCASQLLCKAVTLASKAGAITPGEKEGEARSGVWPAADLEQGSEKCGWHRDPFTPSFFGKYPYSRQELCSPCLPGSGARSTRGWQHGAVRCRPGDGSLVVPPHYASLLRPCCPVLSFHVHVSLLIPASVSFRAMRLGDRKGRDRAGLAVAPPAPI